MKLKIVLIRQPGLFPGLIRWFTGSRWNHCGLVNDSGEVFHLDFQGELVTSLYRKPQWEFAIVPMDWIEQQSPMGGYRYRMIHNLGYMARVLNLGWRPEVLERKTNCVGYVAEILGLSGLSWKAPGELERGVK